MGTPAESESSVRFGEFKLDLHTRKLRSNGHRSYFKNSLFTSSPHCSIAPASWLLATS